MFRQLHIVCLLLLFLLACGKREDFLPDVPVNFSAPVTDPRLIRLSSPGGAVALTGHGISGILIYRTLSGNYVAYDRCSTVNPEKACALNLDEPTITVTDPCSGAKFLLEDGSPAKAPAKSYLKRYQVYIAGNTLHVTN